MTSYPEALRVLSSRGLGIKADIDRISQLVETLGHPELNYPTIHVAGTNGKSSTVRMIAVLLAAHGLKVGTFTSPHLQSYRERFGLVGPADDGLAAEIISKDDFAQTIAYLLQFTDPLEAERGETVTQFELEAALAFDWMSNLPVDVGVFETGLGGRWDATNVIQSKVAVVTPIDVDHARLLGSTPIENAAEKVGIIKKGSSVVTAKQYSDVAAMIVETAAASGSRVVQAEQDFSVTADEAAVGGRLVSVRTRSASYRNLYLPLFGKHQSANLALSISAAEAFLGRALDEDSVRAGLSILTTPGRLEVVRRDPLVVLDGAHNPHAASVMGAALRESFGDLRAIFVLAIFEDKDVEGFLRNVSPFVDEIIFARIRGERPSADPRSLADLWRSVSPLDREVPVGVIEPISEAVEYAIANSLDDGLVVVTGSLWGVGEARDHLMGPID